MRASFVSSSLAIAFASVAACGKAGPVPTGDCTAAQTPAVLAIVTDSVTGLAPAGSASGLAQTGSIVDTLRPWGAQKDTLAGGAACARRSRSTQDSRRCRRASDAEGISGSEGSRTYALWRLGK